MPSTITYVRTATFTWVRTVRDRGYEKFEAEPTTVRVAFETNDAGSLIYPGLAAEIVDEWIETYLADRDMHRAVQFPLNGASLADYLLAVFRQRSQDVVEVSIVVGNERWVATWTDEAS